MELTHTSYMHQITVVSGQKFPVTYRDIEIFDDLKFVAMSCYNVGRILVWLFTSFLFNYLR